MECLILGISDEDEEDVPQSIPFYGEGLDLSLNLAGLEVAVLLFTNPQLVAGQGIASPLSCLWRT
jgi:hypothetical protein